jgi:hypothetical protein
MAATSCSSNEIDNLQSREEVNTFLRTKIDGGWAEVLSEPATADTATYGKNNFFKLDLDANGSTDLVVNGRYLYAVTHEGNGKYIKHLIDREYSINTKHILVTIIHPNNTPLLVVRSYNTLLRHLEDMTKLDTLILKSGDFVEYRPTPTKLQVRQINFSTSGCFGGCPIFELAIQADRVAKYHAIRYNKKSGSFTARIDSAAYSRLLATLQYLNLPTLKDSYQVHWSDDQTVNLEVVFSDGQVKKIRDYGAVGTFGLVSLYAQLYKLRETQGWK